MPEEALLSAPRRPRAVFAFAHGAGAGMRHAFMEAVSDRLVERDVAVLRYEFPYMRAGRRAPDREPVLVAAVREAVEEARRRVPDVPLVAGGKSMGGRMTSRAAVGGGLPGVVGLAFFGFPLHAAGRPSTERGLHLKDVGLPMLFLQGARDRLADLTLLEPLLEAVGPPPSVHVFADADHGFHVPKRSGRTDAEILDEACDVFARWLDGLDDAHA